MRERPHPFRASVAATTVQKFPSFLWPTPHQLIYHVGNLAATHVGALLCSALLCTVTPQGHKAGREGTEEDI